jgi:hypothetical protein
MANANSPAAARALAEIRILLRVAGFAAFVVVVCALRLTA